MLLHLLLILSLVSLWPLTLQAATNPKQVTTLFPPPRDLSFGEKLALSGDTLVVGEPYGKVDFFNPGVVFVYKHTTSDWQLQASLTAPDGHHSEYFGDAVAIDGDTIAIGARSHAHSGNVASGSVYVFVRRNGVWTFQTELVEEQSYGNDAFGASLALQGNTLVVGAPGDRDGSAYVFERKDTTWQLQTRILPEGSDTGVYFAQSLALDGSTLVVGWPQSSGGSFAYVYERTTTGWSAPQDLTTSINVRSPFFGLSVAISGDRLVVGMPRSSTSDPIGTVYVFARNGTQWSLQSSISASDDTEILSFGVSVALDGDTVLVGAPNHHSEGRDIPNLQGMGAAYVYQQRNNTWSLDAFLMPNEQAEAYGFGSTVVVDGQTLAVGAPRTTGLYDGSGTGSALVSSSSALTRATDDSATTPEETPVTLSVLTNDAAGGSATPDPSSVDLMLLHRPHHGAATIDAMHGTITYTPTTDFAGNDTFTYSAGWGLPATVSVTVTSVPDPPRITSTPPTSAVESTPYSYHITTADPDPGDQVHITALAVPPWLSLHDNGDGTADLKGTAAFADIGSYPLAVAATDQTGLHGTQTFTVEVKSFIPSVPTQLVTQVMGHSQIRLTWNDTSTNEEGFVIERRSDDGAWASIARTQPDATTFIDTNATCNTRYDYRVSAINIRGRSPTSEIVSSTIADCTITAPHALVAAVVVTDGLTLQWSDQSDNESGFIVERSPNGVDDWQAIGQTPANVTSYLDRVPACGPDLFYRVRAYNPGAVSEASNTISSSNCGPAAPSNLVAVATSQTSVALSWTDRSTNETNFQIEVSLDAGRSWNVAGTAITDATTSTLPLLTCNTSYRYRVSAQNAQGSTVSDTRDVTTAACVTVYVDQHASGTNNGTSWTDAYTDLQQALAVATNHPLNTLQVWVAKGTYIPTAGTDRQVSFVLPNGNAVYGGFAGTETALTQRNWRANPTVLSGDIGQPGNTSDNSYHVVRSEASDHNTVLDGFTVTGGKADYNERGSVYIGGGLLCTLSSPVIRNSIFVANSAGIGGGIGVVGQDSDPRIENVMVIGNIANEGGGIAMLYGAKSAVRNVVLSGNRASAGGGVYAIFNSHPQITNATFSSNHANGGPALASSRNASITLSNSIVWGNTSPSNSFFSASENASLIVSDSVVQTAVSGERNRVGDPRFVDTDGPDNMPGTLDDDLHLQDGSIAIDAGNNARVPADLLTDFDGNPRFTNDARSADTGVGTAPIVDVGAYEYQPPSTQDPITRMNYVTGKPGSVFLITGTNYQPNTQWSVAVNNVVLGTLMTKPTGDVTLMITTLSNAPIGVYQVALRPVVQDTSTIAAQGVLAYTLDASAPLRDTGSDSVDYTFLVPLTSALPITPAPVNMWQIYLPCVAR